MAAVDGLDRHVGLIPALDMESLDALARVVDATSQVDGVVGYKLGLTAVLRLGLFEAVRRIRALTDLAIVYDHQKAGPDMPDMGPKFVSLCREAAVDGLILFPIAGPRAIETFVGGAVDAGLFPVVGGEIPVPDYTIGGGGFVADDALDRIVRLSAEVGARHFVLPANDPQTVARRTRWILDHVERPVVVLTGFGPLGGDVATAFQAAAGCPARLAVMGRNVYAAADPAEAAKRIVGEMERQAAGPVPRRRAAERKGKR